MDASSATRNPQNANPSSPFAISVEELSTINQDKNYEQLTTFGGAEAIAKAVKSDLSTGIESNESGQAKITIHDRGVAFGTNTAKQVDPKSFFALVLEQIEDPIIILLIIAATVSTILGLTIKEEREEGGWIDGIAIWVAVFVVAFVGATNDYQKDQQFRKLNAEKEVFDVTVIRDGSEGLVKNTELVVGDILVLNTGDRVTADGILFYNNDLVIDEASLTGESEPIKKRLDRDPFCRSGTQVTDGSGRILIIAVGEHSEWGQTLALVTGETDETPLQEKLGALAVAIGKLGMFVGVASFIVLTVRWIVDHSGFPLSKINDEGPIQFFLFAITIVVVAVPEGLPLAVTISLAYSMRKMMKDNNFVRVLSACETMGGATAICSDKTGTLTENRMTVIAGWFHDKYFRNTPKKEELIPEVMTLITENASLNSKAFLIIEDNGEVQFVGNRTECALLMMARTWDVDYRQVRSTYENQMVKVYGFSSAKKMASIIVHQEGVLRLYNKGAAEMVLQHCTHYIAQNGSRDEIGSKKRNDLMQTIEEMATQGLRTLALTYADLNPDEFNLGPNNEPLDESINSKRGLAVPPEEDLVLMAIVGIKDPVRREVPEAVEQCKKAGIFVRMVTGDNIFTAQHIARECGILTQDGIAMEGPDFRRRAEFDSDNLKKELPQLQVLARSSPTDKHTLVSMLRSLGEVVAVTGDGTNDAPALKESDVGLAMGIAGTEVAKEAADIVIMDDNFSSIVKAVLWGRSVFSNIRKFLQFQLTVNVVALAVAFIAAMVGGETPLNVLQLLWVNLIMDTLAALALATENPTPDLLDEKPHGRNEPLISPPMAKHILLQSAYQLVVIFVILYAFPSIFNRYEFPDKDGFYYEYCQNTEGKHFYEDTPVQEFCSDYLNCDDTRQKCSLYDEDQLDDRDLQHGFRDHIKDEYEDEHDDAEIRKNSVVFNSFIFMQIFNEINSRKIRNEYNILQGVFDSPIFCIISISITGLQLIIMFTPMRSFFKVDALNGWEWLFSLAVGLGVIPYSIIIRFFLRLLEKKDNKNQSNV